jgi:formate hydrogenlyase subunit 3/multisubunit Na+/H+ antiporter MnhD subunit
MLIFALLFLPLFAALCVYPLGRRSQTARDGVTLFTVAAVFLLALWLFAQAYAGHESAVSLPVCGMGLYFRADGFRALYALIASFMWLMTTLLSKEYFAHGKKRDRYWLFTMLTEFGTLGVFLADDLYTLFVFFEIISFASYPWVAHEGTKESLSAAATYLRVSVLGGMVTLMGLFMAWGRLGGLSYEVLRTARGDPGMTLPACLILFGFCVKAGMFPVHIWLPKAHPVAPAPASALLSGILTKAGLIGILAVCFNLFVGNIVFGNVLLALGLATILVGAVLALLSVNLKRILACSSVSQIGYILTGIAVCMLLGNENAVPAAGVIIQMINHSLLKLTLFMGAGVIYMNTHKLDLNDIRGFGRGKPALHAVFLLGILGLAGVPGLNGYIGKTLIHEGLADLAAAGALYKAAEWLFLLSAGITAAYTLKLYIAVFWQQHPARQKEFDALNRAYMSARTRFALLVSACLLPILGLFPTLTVDSLARGSAGFLHAETKAVSYFSAGNLAGSLISVGFGAALYLFYVRLRLYCAKDGYVDIRRFDLDDHVYKPVFLKAVPWLMIRLFGTLDRAVENRFIYQTFSRFWLIVLSAVNAAADNIAYMLDLSLFRGAREPATRHAGDIIMNASASLMSGIAGLLNRSFLRKHPIKVDFLYVLRAGRQARNRAVERVTRTVSFGLLLFTMGMLVVLLYLLLER